MGFPGGSDGKESACDAGDLGSIPGLGRSSGGGHGNPFQYSCLEKFMDREAWRAAVHKVVQGRTQLKWLSNSCIPKYNKHTHTYTVVQNFV